METEYKHLTSETCRMDFFKDPEKSVYIEKSEIGTRGNGHSWQIPIHFNDFRILNNNENLLCQILKTKFECQSTLVSPAHEGGSSNSLQVYRKLLAPGLELSVWKGDLTRHAVDAIVNAANEHLLHGGGLACALVKAGGYEIQAESNAYISKYGELAVGEIAVTHPGKLPCKYIIHAVGPQWQTLKKEQCISLLQKAITNILNQVTVSADIDTVAIPALSSGIFRFPLILCTEIIVKTIRTYFQKKQLAGNLKEIHLVSNEDATVDAFKRQSESILGSNELGSWVPKEAMTPFSKMTVNNLTLQVVQGYIELQETEVIVNSLYMSSNLNDGTVSKSILQKAGEQVKMELSHRMTTEAKNNDFLLVTGGYNLASKYIFHVLWNQDFNPSEILSIVMDMCLSECSSKNITSISFPALGTGKINLSKYHVAKVMFEKVLLFAHHYLKEHLIVNFVIFPSDEKIYEVFIQEMAKYKSLLQNHNKVTEVLSVPQRTGAERKGGLRASSPAVSLMGSNLQKMIEAEAWIQRILNLQEQHVIENNLIFYLGKKEHDILSRLQTSKVSISENIIVGKANLEVKGARDDLIKVVLHIELMLCEVGEEMAREKENGIWSLTRPWTNQQPKDQDEMKENTFLKCLRLETSEIQDQKKQFEKCGLQVVKVERIDNMNLRAAFQITKMMMEKKTKGITNSHRLFQQVPYQFCNAICRAGFQRMYSMPCDPKLGAGIYFTKNLRHLAHKDKKTSVTDKFIYVFEAEVLTGNSCQGRPEHVVPPPLSPGAIESHDSLVDYMPNPETFVIFNCMQAMPLYLWTCTQNHEQPQGVLFSQQQQRNEFAAGSHVYQKQQKSFSPPHTWGTFPSGSSVD
ncbi:protein mono-ADP-ribosyltransferase PARP9 [Sorex fumeus]|uniref:protein mono-ADP-ribosyltransferase PARP9 n=1 Tax=Sorex fumeus TaxID=62283 RepID=UPI0024AE311F|nr:protein mono-ADP-ribosyltransferase PARP9 [Sorex fumeus]XP_055965376.1 protein mono-ADP-ribosyltransferase PARP9 [Sorex fumeus]XP_055965377.1 protein mono-ADP-ribosyltransferase PARP9 [Sorex fumeus]XP_055965378.1 protein mono-ADP-ribosyltransferase PARP9 [Sorex fumeus]